MSIHISVESIQGKQRKEIIEEIKQRAKEAALYAIKEVLEAGLEAEVEHQLGRKKGGTRCISRQPRQIECRYLEIRNQVGESGEDGLAKVGRRLSRGAEPSTSSSSSKEKTP